MQQVPFGITQAYKGDSPSQHSCKNPKATQASINPQYPFLFRHNLIATTFPSYPNLVIQVLSVISCHLLFQVVCPSVLFSSHFHPISSFSCIFRLRSYIVSIYPLRTTQLQNNSSIASNPKRLFATFPQRFPVDIV